MVVSAKSIQVTQAAPQILHKKAMRASSRQAASPKAEGEFSSAAKAVARLAITVGGA